MRDFLLPRKPPYASVAASGVTRVRRILVSLKMTERLEQRYCIKFCQKLGDTQAETIRKIQQAFGDNAMRVTQIKEWFNRFKDGRMSADSDQRSGRPSTSYLDCGGGGIPSCAIGLSSPWQLS
jgi:hypothetical protein